MIKYIQFPRSYKQQCFLLDCAPEGPVIVIRTLRFCMLRYRARVSQAASCFIGFLAPATMLSRGCFE